MKRPQISRFFHSLLAISSNSATVITVISQYGQILYEQAVDDLSPIFPEPRWHGSYYVLVRVGGNWESKLPNHIQQVNVIILADEMISSESLLPKKSHSLQTDLAKQDSAAQEALSLGGAGFAASSQISLWIFSALLPKTAPPGRKRRHVHRDCVSGWYLPPPCQSPHPIHSVVHLLLFILFFFFQPFLIFLIVLISTLVWLFRICFPVFVLLLLLRGFLFAFLLPPIGFQSFL